MNNATSNAVRFNVVAACMTNNGAKAQSIKFPRKPRDESDARALFGSMPMVAPEGAIRPWSLGLMLIRWTDGIGREVIAERK